MKRPTGKLMGILGLLAGLALLVFEARRLYSSPHEDAWFWIILAVAIMILSLVELLARPADTPPKLGDDLKG